jgi:hypothetical protein
MPKIENGDRDVLLQQQFIEGVPTELKRELLQRPGMSYEETVAVAQQLDLASQISSHQTGSQVNLASASETNEGSALGCTVDGKCGNTYQKG